jgi:N-acetylglucosaminyldiphosphoundecaprenol N-acetyl-beta-D-mannosaminyltransferase
MGSATGAPLLAGHVTERILGVRVDPVTKRDAVGAIVDRAVAGEPGAFVCLTNVHTSVEAQSSPELRSALEAAFLSVPDGMPLVWNLRRRGYRSTEKVTGVELMPMVAAAGVAQGLRHYLYGGPPGVSSEAGRRLQELVPGSEVVGADSPPFVEAADLLIEGLQERLLVAKPHVLWVGLGAPKQELWMARASTTLSAPVIVGVGAAFDYLAGTKPPAPRVLRHVGLEWLFRLAVEPRRLWRRYLVGNSIFLWLLAREWLTRGTRRRDGQFSKPNGGTARWR